MNFSIVTPSFRSARWLKLCIASVADQAGVEFEHIVQDAGSDDGTLEWLPNDKRVRAYVEKDSGMYDAVNRGYRRAKGDLLAYLNCDEQYLPGALEKVREFFERHPEIDVVFGDCLVVDQTGAYICERRALPPQLLHTWTGPSLSFLTAATFIRRRVLDEKGLFFRPELRDLGDAEWALRLVKTCVRTGILPEFLSIFTETGQNMNLGANAATEQAQFRASAPAWVRALGPLALAHYRLRRWRAGHYSCRQHDYAIYTTQNPAARKVFHVAHPTFRWLGRV